MAAETRRPSNPDDLMAGLWAQPGAGTARAPVPGAPQVAARSAGTPALTGVQRVGFGLRLGAFVIDWAIQSVLIVIAIVGFAGVAVTAVIGGRGGQAPDGANAVALFAALFGALFLIFGVLTLYNLIEGFTGWSPGKLVLGLRIRDADGAPAPVGRLLGRYAVKNSGTILTFLDAMIGLGMLSILGALAGLAIFVGCFFTLGARRQAFHDMIAGTAVYRKADLPA